MWISERSKERHVAKEHLILSMNIIHIDRVIVRISSIYTFIFILLYIRILPGVSVQIQRSSNGMKATAMCNDYEAGCYIFIVLNVAPSGSSFLAIFCSCDIIAQNKKPLS